MAGVEEVEVVVARSERATPRAGDAFLKVDTDQGSCLRMLTCSIPASVRARRTSTPMSALMPESYAA